MRFQTVFFLLYLITAFSGGSAFSQKPDTVSLTTIIAKTQNFSASYPAEKVHLHFDKPYYAVGDTIWLKAYVTSGLHMPSQLSKIVYVDIISSKDALIQTLKLPVSQSVAWGNIPLPALNYKEGNYRVRAYTRWMMNYDPAYFFSKNVSIGSSEKKVATHITFIHKGSPGANIIYRDTDGKPLASKQVTWEIDVPGKKPLKGKEVTDQQGRIVIDLPDNQEILNKELLATSIDLGDKTLVSNSFPLRSAGRDIDLQFFPEGGKLINGVPVKVAFKALKADGLGIDIKGTITDNEGKVVAEFGSQHAGMGTFVLVPEAGKTYRAGITSPAGYSNSYTLPQAISGGITLAVNNTGAEQNLGIKIMCSNEFFSLNQNKNFYLVAKVGEVICYAAQTLLQKQVYTAAIPKNKFPTGIVQLTLFAASGEPLSERLVFVRQQDGLNLSLKTEKPVYGRRQKVRLMLSAKKNMLPAEANLSVAVVDEAKVPFNENAETTILSNLLLTSDLKGFIEKPNYYFNNPTDKTDADLDVLMLTQGYRRFLYKDIIAGTPPPVYFMPEQGIDVTGILRTSNGMPINKGNVKLRIPDKYFTSFAVTDGGGVFKFPNLAVADSSEVIISSLDYRYKDPMLTVDNTGFQPVLGSVRIPEEHLNIDSILNPYLQNNKRIFKNSHMLGEVVVTAKAAPRVASHLDYPSLSGLGTWPEHLIPKERFADCPSFLNCIKTLGMGTTYDNERFYVSRDYNTGNRTPMQVFYNGMPVDASYLNTLNSNDVESVEIFLRDDLGLVNRSYNANGALVINGKKIEKKSQMKLEDIQKLLPKSGEVKFRIQGYTIAREFYSPKYAVQQAIQNNDLRTTIYWNPKVKTDKATGNSVIEYYNADGRGSYRVIVEGMDDEGRIGRQVYRYKVE